MNKNKYENIIIGAGIAGLTSAYKLHKEAKEFLLIEASDSVGGNWSSRFYKDSVYEFGPNTLMNRSEEINSIISSLGIEDEVLKEEFKDSVRYLYLDQKFYEIGSNPLKFLLSGILSPWEIIRIALEPFQKREIKDDESVYDFISRRFGKAIAKKIVHHAVKGIWAGDSRTLSARVALKNLVNYEKEYGSVIKGLLSQRKKPKSKKLPLASISFKKGLQFLTQAIADSFPSGSILLNTKVMSLQAERSSPYTIKLDSGEEIQTDNLIIATKAYQAGDLLKKINPYLNNMLKQIYYAPVFLLSFSIPKSKFKNKSVKGFGYISGERKHLVLGTIYSSELYPERNLADEYLMTCFLGGSKNPQILDFDQGDLILRAISEQKEVIKNSYGIDLEDKDFNIVDHQLFDKAIPQYHLGYKKLLHSIYKELKKYPGFTLLGNYLNGVSIPDTVKLALGHRD